MAMIAIIGANVFAALLIVGGGAALLALQAIEDWWRGR